MLISSLKIKKYRGLDINIDTIEKVSIIIGQNDSGKTNICSAIMKVLDYNKRRIPFVLTDSTNSNKEDIAEKKNRIMTIHSSKGLENDNVIIVLNNKYNNINDEFRNKLFVAITRAKDNVYILSENNNIVSDYIENLLK